MMIALCMACRYGDHAGHVARVAPPEGMLGGSECPCAGDCKIQPEIAREIAAVCAAVATERKNDDV